jgi:hypothetical protein
VFDAGWKLFFVDNEASMNLEAFSEEVKEGKWGVVSYATS